MGNCLNNDQPNVTSEIEAANNTKDTPNDSGDKQVYGDNNTPKTEPNEAKPQETVQKSTADTDAQKEKDEKQKRENEETERLKQEKAAKDKIEKEQKERYAQEQREKEQKEKETQKANETEAAKETEAPKSNVVVMGSNVQIGGNVQIGTTGNTVVINNATNEVTVKKEVFYANDKEMRDDIKCVGNSKTYAGYPLTNMYTSSTDYWCSEDATDVYLIFDTKNAKISKWKMTMGYDCTKVTFSSSETQNGTYSDITSGKPSEENNLQQKNKRYIKLTFDGVDNGYVGITELNISGSGGDPTLPDETAEQTTETKEDTAPEATYEIEEDTDEAAPDENAIDISLNPKIKPVASHPELSDLAEQAKKAMNGQPYDMMMLYERDTTKDVWITLDCGPMKIDTLEIGFFALGDNKMNATVVKVYTCADNATFTMVKLKKNVEAEKGAMFVLKSKHDRYIRIACEDRPNNGNVGITKLKLNGFELKEDIKGSISDKVVIYQALQQAHRASDPNTLLKNTPDGYQFPREPKAWLIFDMRRYELEKFVVRFKSHKQVPGVVKLKLSDVAPRYSFSIPSAYKWKVDIPQEYAGSDEIEKAWKEVTELQEFVLSGHEYDGGFKRYAMLEFSHYHYAQIELIRVQVFGKLSTRIAPEDEQFQVAFDGDGLGEEKKDNVEPYQPDFVDSSPTQQGMPLENIWKKEPHLFWMGQYGTEPFLVLDLGNNQSKLKQILVQAYASYIYETLKISTSDKIKSGWEVVIEDKEMEQKMQDGGLYDMGGKGVKKYIKLEFFGLKMMMCGVSSIKLFGDGEFLEREEKEITIEDIKNLKYKDEDLIQQFREKLQGRSTARMTSKMTQCSLIEQDKSKGKGCDEWKRLKTEYYEIMGEMYYMYTPIYAYTADTVYEQELLLQTAVEQEKMGKAMAQQLLDNELDYVVEEMKLKETEQNSMDSWQKVLTDTTVPQTKKLELQKIYQTNQKATQAASTEYYAGYSKLMKECSDKISKLFSLPKSKTVYNAWKEAIIHGGGRKIDSSYTVKEYENAVDQYGRINDEDGLRQCFSIMAEKFDKSIEDQTEYLHKFFIYQLNSGYKYQTYARSASYGIPPVSILFDVGEDLDQKISWIAFKCPRLSTNAIIVSTADELKEEKTDSPDADDDEMRYNYNNFNVIGQIEFDDQLKVTKKDSTDGGVGYDDTRVELGFRNRRYIKVDFDKWDEKEQYFSLEIQRVKFMAKDESFEDEDQKEGGEELSKYKLKLIEDNTGPNSHRGIDNAYKLDTSEYYETQHGEMQPWMIFDCETRKIDKFEIGFDDTRWRKFEKFVVYTSDAPDKDEFKEIVFEDTAADMDTYIAKSVTDVKTIEVNQNHKRYIKFVFELTKDSNQLEMKRLKFYTTDPPNEYKWDIDENIKNLTYKVKIISANKCSSGQKPENMMTDVYGLYHTAVYGKTHKEQIEDKIRDEVCRGVNLLRQTRGGKITKHEKHFIKYLLCFQNKRNYAEMLYQAKLVMGLLRKPLVIEYKRLQSINSPILSLKLDAKYKCEDSIVSNHGLLEWDYAKWYKPRQALFWPKDLKPLSDEWKSVGLILKDPEFKGLQRSTAQEPDKPFVTADELAMEYLNLVAYKLDSGFQKQMKELFKENRLKMGRSFPTNNADLNVQSGPVKTKARQKIKVDLKYFVKPAPQCMAVLDIVRCGIVCEDDTELCSLYQLIMEKYEGSIMRVKNAFDDIRKGDDSHGYRAVMINIAFGDEGLLPKGYKMVCEAQLLLNKYYQVRKDMHLGYGICRSEDGGTSDTTSPYIVLARDCAKFGKLDI